MEKNSIVINDQFWSTYRELIRTEMIPYQWKVLNDDIAITIEKERNDAFIPNEKSHAIENLKIAAGIRKGEHYGWVFQDSDVYKWLEAVAYTLRNKEDEKLRKLADQVVELIGNAQEKSGYLDTYFTIKDPDRKLKRLYESHELYCAGHYLEAAVAYHEATGNQQAIDIACKLADYLYDYFMNTHTNEVDGHPEIEIGLMRLYHLTQKEDYLKLCKHFLVIRGTEPDIINRQREGAPGEDLIPGMNQFPLSYFQMHKPLLEQLTAEGHAVRRVYLSLAMADVANTSKDTELFEVCKKVWRNIVDKRIYITGGIGSTVLGESFTFDYDLPNDTMYCETCASVGFVLFAHKMLECEANSEYADLMERALYNTILSGVALDGKHFFYVNPLEVRPENSKKDPGKSHVKCVRPQWLGCACCPPNLARLLSSLEQYIYHVKEDTIYVDLFINSEAKFTVSGQEICIKQESDYPWKGNISIDISGMEKTEGQIAIRIPNWAGDYRINLNGKDCNIKSQNGYLILGKQFEEVHITLKLDMPVQRWKANSSVSEDVGKVAVTRGPIVYCLEEVDNGPDLNLLRVDEKTMFTLENENGDLGKIVTIEGNGYRIASNERESQPLYKKWNEPDQEERVKLKWIPYYCWANRGENEMRVWVRQ